MVECVVKNWQGESVGEASLDWKVASSENAPHILHRAVVRQLTNARQGTASTKTRAEVRGGGKKPWRQKGTGRARAGSSRSPLWRGGGVIFGPKPRNFNIKMNRKERRLALRTALSGCNEGLIIVESFSDQISQPKTKDLFGALQRWGIDQGEKVLMILAEIPENVYLSARNIANLKLISTSSINVYDILNANHIVISADAFSKIQEVYSD